MGAYAKVSPFFLARPEYLERCERMLIPQPLLGPWWNSRDGESRRREPCRRVSESYLCAVQVSLSSSTIICLSSTLGGRLLEST